MSDKTVNKDRPFSMRMYAEDYDKLDYWSEKYEMTRAELLVVAMNHYIGWRNGDYDLPRAERQRLNQLTDAIASLIVTNEHLETSIISGFNSMLGIIRGENYLVEKETGDL